MERPVYSRRFNAGSLRNKNGSWVVRYYPAPGAPQRSVTVGRSKGKKKITESEAKRRMKMIIDQLNAEPQSGARNFTVAEFINEVYIPVKTESEWREGTAQTTVGELNRWIVPNLGDFSIRRITAQDLRKVLMDLKANGEPQRTLDRTRFYLGSIVRLAMAEGLIDRAIHEGIVKPSSIAPARNKLTVSIAIYFQAWRLLDERERLIWDLIMFMGLRKCEVFALQRKHVGPQTINVEQGVYLGRIVGPKTYASKRLVGIIPEIRERLGRYMRSLIDESPNAWLFPSTTLDTPIDPHNLRKHHIRPKLKDANLQWISFQIIRRSHTTHNHKIGADPATMAKQQGHGIGVHADVYYQPDPETLIRESSKLYAEFHAEVRRHAALPKDEVSAN